METLLRLPPLRTVHLAYPAGYLRTILWRRFHLEVEEVGFGGRQDAQATLLDLDQMSA